MLHRNKSPYDDCRGHTYSHVRLIRLRLDDVARLAMVLVEASSSINVRLRGGRAACTRFFALSNAYTRVGCIRARERSCASMARYLDARERHCGLSAYARRERVRGAIEW